MKKYPNIVLSNVLVKVLLKDTTVTNVELLRRLNGGKDRMDQRLFVMLADLHTLKDSKEVNIRQTKILEECDRLKKTLDRKELIETLSARDYDEPEFEPEEVAVPEGGVGPQQMEEPIARGELSKLLSEYSNFFSDI
ncbi:hypothetical protein RCL1_003649 [Eukaryota sp. TZLM3-RCL]